MSGQEVEIALGNTLPLSSIPVGTQVHNIEMHPGKGGQLVRSAGSSLPAARKEGRYVTLHLPSTEVRLVPKECRATIGTAAILKTALLLSEKPDANVTWAEDRMFAVLS